MNGDIQRTSSEGSRGSEEGTNGESSYEFRTGEVPLGLEICFVTAEGFGGDLIVVEFDCSWSSRVTVRSFGYGMYVLHVISLILVPHRDQRCRDWLYYAEIRQRQAAMNGVTRKLTQ